VRTIPQEAVQRLVFKEPQSPAIKYGIEDQLHRLGGQKQKREREKSEKGSGEGDKGSPNFSPEKENFIASQ